MAKSKLFSPVTIGSHTFKNRVFMSPMCMYITTDKDGRLTQKRRDHYLARALGGVGAIVIEATAVSPQGGISDTDFCLYNDEQEADLSSLVKDIHTYDCKVGIQISHAGRKGMGWEEVVSSSALSFNPDDESFKVPRALSTEEVEAMIADFVACAQRAYRAGVDFVEIHGAHGYIVSQFISPLVNYRDDKFGGSLENRYRFLGDIIKGIKKSVPQLDLHLRISADEIDDGGNSFADIVQILKWAEADGVCFFDISSGGITPKPPVIYPGYQAELASRLTKEGLRVGAVGLLKEPDLCEYILRSGDCEVIYLGRPLLENPNWCYSAALTLHDKPDFAIPVYSRGF